MLPLAPGRERTAPQAADGRVDLGHPALHRGQHVGLSGAAGVVEVHPDVGVTAADPDGLDQVDHPPRGRRPDRVAEGQLVGPEIDGAEGDVDHPFRLGSGRRTDSPKRWR